MIKAAQEAGVIFFFGLIVWGLLMGLAVHFNLQWAFWLLILVLVVGVIWFMIWWPWPRVTNQEKV